MLSKYSCHDEGICDCICVNFNCINHKIHNKENREQTQCKSQLMPDDFIHLQQELCFSHYEWDEVPIQKTQTLTPLAQLTPMQLGRKDFTLDQILLAMEILIDAGEISILNEIIKSFNVESIIQLPKEQYSALVVKLREEGAQI